MTGILDQGMLQVIQINMILMQPFHRKFWHTYLPRLKYHNPTVAMSIDRSKDQEGPATMTVYFKDPSAPEDTGPKSSTINMKHRHESEILSQLMSLTKATPVAPTSEEAEQLRSLEEHRIQSEKDSARSHEVNEKRKQKEAILAQARGQGSSMQKA
jgi:large subunit ribosomal protein MRP49